MAYTRAIQALEELIDGSDARPPMVGGARESVVLEWTEGMGDVVFCSHTWLRYNHPDSEAGDKFSLLTGLLRKMQAGKLEIRADINAAMILKDANKKLRIRAKELKRRLTDGYVFFDYMSIPQAPSQAFSHPLTPSHSLSHPLTPSTA